MTEQTESQPTAATPPGRPAQKMGAWVFFMPSVVCLILGILIGMSIGGGSSPSQSAPVAKGAAKGAEPALKSLERRDPQDKTAIGVVDAPVVMVVYSDFQCPYCAKWESQTLPAVINKYVNSGKLRIEWRDLAIFGESSGLAAQAAVAAAEQGKYLEYRTQLTRGGQIPDASAFTEAGLQDAAVRLKINPEQFVADVHSQKTKDFVEKNYAEARRVGMGSTPSFLVNTVPIKGAQPIAVFEQLIDQQLAEKATK